jgi:hypothetical protein
LRPAKTWFGDPDKVNQFRWIRQSNGKGRSAVIDDSDRLARLIRRSTAIDRVLSGPVYHLFSGSIRDGGSNPTQGRNLGDSHVRYI